MAANMALVKERGISDEAVRAINLIHEQLDDLIVNVDKNTDRERHLSIVRELEYMLQLLWGFPQDASYHTWVPRLQKRFRELDYIGVTYRCTKTGREATLTREALASGKLFGIGEGFIDFGGVVRIVGPIERVK